MTSQTSFAGYTSSELVATHRRLSRFECAQPEDQTDMLRELAEVESEMHRRAGATTLVDAARQLLTEIDGQFFDELHPLTIHSAPLRAAIAKATTQEPMP